jgi:hypothetical protein
MTEAQVSELIASAATHGREFDHFDAGLFLLAKEVLARGKSDPNYEYAQTAVQDFSRYMTTGQKKYGFAMLLLGIPYTVEEIAHSEKLRQEFLAYQEKHKEKSA